MRILSITHGPTVPGGVFDEVVQAAGHELERWVVPLGGMPQPASSYDALMVFGGSMHPDQDEQFGWLEREAEVFAQRWPRTSPCSASALAPSCSRARPEPGSGRRPRPRWAGSRSS